MGNVAHRNNRPQHSGSRQQAQRCKTGRIYRAAQQRRATNKRIAGKGQHRQGGENSDTKWRHKIVHKARERKSMKGRFADA